MQDCFHNLHFASYKLQFNAFVDIDFRKIALSIPIENFILA